MHNDFRVQIRSFATVVWKKTKSPRDYPFTVIAAMSQGTTNMESKSHKITHSYPASGPFFTEKQVIPNQIFSGPAGLGILTRRLYSTYCLYSQINQSPWQCWCISHLLSDADTYSQLLSAADISVASSALWRYILVIYSALLIYQSDTQCSWYTSQWVPTHVGILSLISAVCRYPCVKMPLPPRLAGIVVSDRLTDVVEVVYVNM